MPDGRNSLQRATDSSNSVQEEVPPALPRTLRIVDPAQVARQYRVWQRRVLFTTTVGYALFYFVRKNLSFAMPLMEQDLGILKQDLGLFLTLQGLVYGVSKFINGLIGDQVNARWFMVCGLACSAVVNVFFGLSSAVIFFGLFWMLNGWFQGMGFPPCARLLTHWFPPQILATKMSIWNTSVSLGAGGIAVLCGYLVQWNWRLCFFVPAALALTGAFFLALALRDTPESLGLPEVEGTSQVDRRGGHAAAEPFARILFQQVFTNPHIWLVSLANFFVYIVRYGILDWGPTFLKQAKNIELVHAGWMVAAFEITGIAGMLTSGWVTDKIFGGRGSRTCLFYMLLCLAALMLFWKLPLQSVLLNTVFLCAAGFFVYGPQCLIAIVAANLATKKAAATAVGLTGIFGYGSTILSGLGVGILVERFGWDAGFLMFVIAALIGVVLFAACWPVKAHGYRQETTA
jgi:phosphoglycerate transporter family protein